MNLQEINIRQKLYIILAENGIAGCNNHKINNMLSEEKKDISLSSSLNTRKWWLNGYWEATQKHLFIHMKRIRIIIIKSKIFIEMNTVGTYMLLLGTLKDNQRIFLFSIELKMIRVQMSYERTENVGPPDGSGVNGGHKSSPFKTTDRFWSYSCTTSHIITK